MIRRNLSSEKGLTLVELLVTLAIIGSVGVMIIGILLGGIGSFKRVNSQVALHDEANYIMTKFVNTIYEATSVTYTGSADQPEITVKKYGATEPTTLGFKDGKAFINGEEVSSTGFTVDSTKSKIMIDDQHNNVFIKLVIEVNGSSDKRVILANNVSYVKVEAGTGGST